MGQPEAAPEGRNKVTEQVSTSAPALSSQPMDAPMAAAGGTRTRAPGSRLYGNRGSRHHHLHETARADTATTTTGETAARGARMVTRAQPTTPRALLVNERRPHGQRPTC